MNTRILLLIYLTKSRFKKKYCTFLFQYNAFSREMNENIWRINCKSVDAFDKNINKFIVLFNLLVYCNVTIGPPCIVAIFHRFEQETKIDLEGKSGGEGEEGREKNLFEATFQE